MCKFTSYNTCNMQFVPLSLHKLHMCTNPLAAILRRHSKNDSTKMKTVAFLDLLGFGQVALKDTVGAIELISDYQVIINNKVTDATIHPDLLTTAEEICADSFETLLPFSDSIFITSTDPNKFVKQVAHLLSHSFLINANQYSHPDNPSNPLETEITDTGLTTRKIKTNRYPVLFRGGVSFGEVANLTINSIVNNNIAPLTNLTGAALVEAVYLEKAGKGPRIFCNKKFVDQLDQNTKDKFIGVVKTDELYEIYWTTSIFFDQNDCRIDIREFDKHFIPAVNLWKAFNHLDYGIQYYEFIKLTVKGTLQYYRFKNCEQIAIDYIKNKVNSVGLEVKWDDLTK